MIYECLDIDESSFGIRVYEENGHVIIEDDRPRSYESFYISEEQIEDELYECYRERVKVKRKTHEAYVFEENAGVLISNDAKQIRSFHWKPHGYRDFKVFHPERVISAPMYADRIVEYWLTEKYIAPYVSNIVHERNMACQKGKGPGVAKKYMEDMLYQLYDKYGTDFYFFQADVQKYYDNINHERVKEQFSDLQEFPKRLFFNILDDWSSRDCYAKVNDPYGVYGIPKGTLPSQWIGITYLNDLDWIMASFEGSEGNVRYMDDFVVFFKHKEDANRCREFVTEYFESNHMGVRLHPRKTVVAPMSRGFTFCGFRYTFNGTGKLVEHVRRERKELIIKRYNKMQDDYYHGKLSDWDVDKKKNGTEAFLKQGTNKRLVRYINHRFKCTKEPDEFYKAGEPTKKKHLKPSRIKRRMKRELERKRKSAYEIGVDIDGQESFIFKDSKE